MRWVFQNTADAESFHKDMLFASRADSGNGYLDGPDCKEIPLSDGAVPMSECAVLYTSNPRKRPKRMNTQMAANPLDFVSKPLTCPLTTVPVCLFECGVAD